jgi:hypothetical protein
MRVTVMTHMAKGLRSPGETTGQIDIQDQLDRLKWSLWHGDRYRHGEPISTAMTESAVNQVISKRFVKRQQMKWTKRGAHLLLQVRTDVLNDELRDLFCRWYPGMQTSEEPAQQAA